MPKTNSHTDKEFNIIRKMMSRSSKKTNENVNETTPNNVYNKALFLKYNVTLFELNKNHPNA